MEHNPYAPPVAPIADRPEASAEIASRLRRFLNMLIDFAGLMVFAVLIGAGKLITGTRVVTESGEVPTARQILIRTVVRFVPFEAFSFLGSSGTGWHDTWSGTRVVRTRRARDAG
jgi:uncharacterized RDD family membrane protein YckC